MKPADSICSARAKEGIGRGERRGDGKEVIKGRGEIREKEREYKGK